MIFKNMMMEQYYTNERNVQILVSLLKQHGIKRIIVSPGSTNVTFVGSVQQDSYFELYSCIDERSAAYMACGMAAETCEPVALSCTGATAARNYFSALTEAYYRKLPVLAITSSQDISRISHLIPQVTDRSRQPLDTVKMSVLLQNVKDADDEWDCMIKANKAILELRHRDMGPVHINLCTTYSPDFNVRELPIARKIDRICLEDTFPEIKSGKVAIYVGSHKRWSQTEIEYVDQFCATYNAVVFVDPTSNYTGKYRVNFSLVSGQQDSSPNNSPDLLIHIGDMSDMLGVICRPKEVWRVSEDGELCDPYRSLSCVFEMSEKAFFQHYINKESKGDNSYYNSCIKEYESLMGNLPDLPFSHLWIASQIHDRFPASSTIHLGILSPLRSWSFFEIDKSIEVYCNQGGFGIDGNMSSMIGASMVSSEKLFYGIVGDLSFFYDMNCLGNRHIGNNIRILLVNNSLGAEFMLFKQRNSIYVNDVQDFISAGGHNGCQSPSLVKGLSESLGFEYMSASSKEEFSSVSERFLCPEMTDRPMIFEIFVNPENENDALYQLKHIRTSVKKTAKTLVKNILHGNGAQTHPEKYQISKNHFK